MTSFVERAILITTVDVSNVIAKDVFSSNETLCVFPYNDCTCLHQYVIATNVLVWISHYIYVLSLATLQMAEVTVSGSKHVHFF